MMDDPRETKYDFNPGEEARVKLNSPRKPKRLSLAPELFLPKITESGELPMETCKAKSCEGGLGTHDRQLALNGDLTSESEDTHSEIEIASEVSAHSEQVEAIINELAKMEEEDCQLITNETERKDVVNDNVTFKKSKGVPKMELNSSRVQTSVVKKKTPKRRAINKLVKENSKDILCVLEKIKSFHRTKEPTTNKHQNRCPHCKVLSNEDSSGPESCLVCEITNAAEKFTSLDTNRFLVEILYPHDFYDKYSRSRRKLIGIEPNQHPVQVPIIKPAKVLRKSNTTKPVLLRYNTKLDSPDSNKENAIVNDLVSTRQREAGPINDSNHVRSRLFGLDQRDKSALHSKCGEGNNSVFIYEDSNGDKPLLKGLRGGLKKENLCKEKQVNKQVSQSMYEVNSLGMQFSLPEYNTSLSSRRPSLTQEATTLLPQSPYIPISPRHLTMFEGGNNRITPLSRTFHRGITFAGFDNFKNISPPFIRNKRERTCTDQKEIQGTLPMKFNGKTTMITDTSSKNQNSLPPIENNNNVPSVFLTSRPT